MKEKKEKQVSAMREKFNNEAQIAKEAELAKEFEKFECLVCYEVRLEPNSCN